MNNIFQARTSITYILNYYNNSLGTRISKYDQKDLCFYDLRLGYPDALCWLGFDKCPEPRYLNLYDFLLYSLKKINNAEARIGMCN